MVHYTIKNYVQYHDINCNCVSRISMTDDHVGSTYLEEVRLSTARTGISERGISSYPVKYLLFREALEARSALTPHRGFENVTMIFHFGHVGDV